MEKMSAVEIHTPTTLEPDRPQHERSAACVITQQYSSAVFVLLLALPFTKEKIRHVLKYDLI
jgi:hypothetical protein